MLFLLMIEKVGLMIIFMFFVSIIKPFRYLVKDNRTYKEKLALIAVFSLFGIISNLTGIEFDGENVMPKFWSKVPISEESIIVTTRTTDIVIGSLLGGPVVGFCIGLIAGLHRFFQGGFTAAACLIAAIICGIASGFLGNYCKRKYGRIPYGLGILMGVAMELLQNGIILAISEPSGLAMMMVRKIALSMSGIIAISNFIFILLMNSILKSEEEQTRLTQMKMALSIADQTLPFFRNGFNEESCKEAALFIYKMTNAERVMLSNTTQVLAAVGLPEKSEQVKLCFPLMVEGNIRGFLEIYYHQAWEINNTQATEDRGLAELLSKIISTQLELANAELQNNLLKDLKIKALQSQVNPHFLFNAINTISVLCRTDPDKARELLQNLATFFRNNLYGMQNPYIHLHKELELVEAYLAIEQSRFPNKCHVVFRIDEQIKNALIPSSVLQILVENACKHAFSNIKRIGHIEVTVYTEADSLYIIVRDDGTGIPEEKLPVLGKTEVFSEKGTGTSLFNLHERLIALYGQDAKFQIKTAKGTEVTISIPFVTEAE